MFNIERPFRTKVPIDGQMTVITVRFPTDQEFLQYHNTRRVVDISLGRGKSETDVEKAQEAAVALYAKIGKEPTSIPPAAAEIVVGKMLRAEVVTAEPGSPAYVVTLRALNVEGLRHCFRMPSAEQLKRFDTITKVIGDARRAEYHVSVNTAAALYDELVSSSENYVGSVPILHKHVAVAGLMKAVREEMDAEGEDFF